VHDKRETYVSGLVDSTASIRSDLDIGEYAKRSARDLPRWYVSWYVRGGSIAGRKDESDV